MTVSFTRRGVLALAGASALSSALSPAFATGVDTADAASPPSGEGARQHAITVFGNPALPRDFTHFPYVNPDAPRGGAIKLLPSSFAGNQNPLTFNTFNMYILRGDSPPLMQLCHASLMVRNLDEPDAVYGHIAEGVALEPPRLTFFIRAGLTFSDGSPITAHDAAFTLNIMKEEAHPSFREQLRPVLSAQAVDDRTLVLELAQNASNRLPPLIAAFPVLSKPYFEANDFTAATLDVPVTSGPYVVGNFEPGRYVEFVRRDAFWGDGLPTGVGHNNFATVRVDFYRDRTAGFEAFKSGVVTFREEFTSKTWATEYNFPAVRDGSVVTREFDDGRPAGAQGWFINTRRAKFADPRTRQALTAAFDFEWTNENLFYGLYDRTVSFFMNSAMVAEGEPTPEELALLEPFRDQVDEAVFGPAWLPPQTDGSGRDRAPLRIANELLTAAGWRRENNRLVNDAGEELTVEFLYRSPTFERIIQPYASRLRLLGINATLRFVDPSQYADRVQNFDFDLTTSRYALGPTPGEAMRQFFTSDNANTPGSYNLAGMSDPVIDALVEAMIKAPTRETMITAARALDRVVRVGHYWVPQWYKGSHHVAYWDEFGIPEAKPVFDLPVATTWWSRNA